MSFSLSDTKKTYQESYMIFGGINEDQYTGKLFELPLVNNNWWATQTTGVYFNGQQLNSYTGSGTFGIIDTGTSFILIPGDEFNQIIKLINAQVDSSKQFNCNTQECTQYSALVPCPNFYSLPDITFEFAYTKFNMSPKAYLMDIPGGCLFAILPNYVDETQYLMGDAFLRHFYQVYDFENQMVKLAVDAHSKDIVSIGEPYFSNFLLYAILVIAVIIIISSGLVFKYCKNRKKKEVQVSSGNPS